MRKHQVDAPTTSITLCVHVLFLLLYYLCKLLAISETYLAYKMAVFGNAGKFLENIGHKEILIFPEL
jgi:hypothetical protein